MARDARLLALAAALALSLLAAGSGSAGPVQVLPLVEHWNGTTWTRVPVPPGASALQAVVAPSADDVWMFGWHDTALHWDGSSWHRSKLPLRGADGPPEFPGAAAVSADDIWAVGDAERTGSKYAVGALIEHWNGHAWRQVPGMPPLQYSRLSAVTALSANDAWAVGASGFDTGRRILDRTLALHWDGKAWRRVPTPNPAAPGMSAAEVSATLVAVAAVAPGQVWAVGHYYVVTNGHHGYRTLVLRWDGKSWTQVPSVDPGGPRRSNLLNGVAAVASNDVWAVGSFSRHGPQPLAEHWDGTRWRVVRAAGGPLNGVSALGAKDVWAVGQGDAARWDGSSWQAVPTPKARLGSYEALSAVAAVAPTDVWGVGIREP